MIDGYECYLKYGMPYDIKGNNVNEQLQFERKHMVLYDVEPELEIINIPKRIYCNKDLVSPLRNAFKNLIESGAVKELKTFDGCFLPRPIRGYETVFNSLLAANKIDKAVSYLSLHSWGIAIDVNAAWNRLGKEPTLSEEFVECFKKAGFDWGGDFQRKDGMHFQLSVI